MNSFPATSGGKLIKFLQQRRLAVVRTRGSHHFLRHADGRVPAVPTHANESIGIGLLLKILKDCDITKEDYRKKI